MTVSSTDRTAGPFDGDGSTTAFDFGFRIFTEADVKVALTAADGTVTTLTRGSDFTIAVNGDQRSNPGGTLTMLEAPAIGEVLDVTSEIEITQGARLLNGGGWYPETVETALDKLTVIAQQQDVTGQRVVRAPFPETLDELPDAPTRASKLVGFDSDGDLTVLAPTSGSAADLALTLAGSGGAGEIGYGASTVEEALDGMTKVMVPFTTAMTAQQRSDLLNAMAVDAAGKHRLVIPAHPDGPGVCWTIEEAIKLPSYSYLAAESWRQCGLKLSDTAVVTENVVTNLGNTGLEHADYNEFIVVEGLLIDGNAERSVSGTVGENVTGVGVGFACVKWGIVRGNKIFSTRKHCIDFSASIYNKGQGGTLGDDQYPTGPSMYCSAYENECYDSADDCITTHSSSDLWIERNLCYKTTSRRLDLTNSNGIEIDEGSYRVKVRDNRIRGGQYMSRGVEVKGHGDTPAARDVTVDGNWVSKVVIGVCVRHIDHGDSGAGDPESPTGFAVQVTNNRIWDVGTKNGNNSVTGVSANGIEVYAFDGVLIRGNTLLNENDTFDDGLEVIMMYNGARNVRVENNDIRGFLTADYGIRATSSCRGGITITGNYLEDSGASRAVSVNTDDITIGGNTYIWNGTPSGTDIAVFLESTTAISYKEPDRVEGYTYDLKVKDTICPYDEPIWYAPEMTWAVGRYDQRMRLSTNGTLLVGANATWDVGTGTQDGFSAEQGGLTRISRDDATPLAVRRRTSNGNIASFYRDTTNVGSISVTTTNTAYNTSSDRRLKENIVTFSGAAAVIDALQVRSYTWKINDAPAVGFIADELSAVVPEAVTGEANAVDENGLPVYQGVDYSKLVPYLVAEIKSLRARVAALEA